MKKKIQNCRDAYQCESVRTFLPLKLYILAPAASAPLPSNMSENDLNKTSP